ncbi:unnamed protein product, partial [Polarella glacialis]
VLKKRSQEMEIQAMDLLEIQQSQEMEIQVMDHLEIQQLVVKTKAIRDPPTGGEDRGKDNNNGNEDHWALTEGMQCWRKREVLHMKSQMHMMRTFIYTGKDAWAGCQSFLSGWVVYETVDKPNVTTDKCVERMTDDMGVINPAWMNDPCCNWLKRRQQCCAPRALVQKVKVVKDVDQTNIASYAAATGTGNLALEIALSFSSMETSAAASCFQPFKDFTDATKDVWKVGEVCWKAVAGDWSNSLGMVVGSKCSVDDDCYTGACAKLTTSSKGSSSSAGGVAQKYCKVPEQMEVPDFATPVIACMVAKTMPRVSQFFAYSNGLAANASSMDIAKAVLALPKMFDMQCHGNGVGAYSLTEEAECKAQSVCNWNSEVRNNTLCQDPCFGANCTNYCREAGNPWEVSEQSLCTPRWDRDPWSQCQETVQAQQQEVQENCQQCWQTCNRETGDCDSCEPKCREGDVLWPNCLASVCAQKCDAVTGTCGSWNGRECIFPDMSFTQA